MSALDQDKKTDAYKTLIFFAREDTHHKHHSHDLKQELGGVVRAFTDLIHSQLIIADAGGFSE